MLLSILLMAGKSTIKHAQHRNVLFRSPSTTLKIQVHIEDYLQSIPEQSLNRAVPVLTVRRGVRHDLLCYLYASVIRIAYFPKVWSNGALDSLFASWCVPVGDISTDAVSIYGVARCRYALKNHPRKQLGYTCTTDFIHCLFASPLISPFGRYQNVHDCLLIV